MNARAPFATVALLLPVEAALAQADAAIPPRADVVITGSLRAQRTLEAPFAITSVDSQALREAGPMINLSEGLARVPGLVVANRSNCAQDLQINSRVFGARAGFGVRGIRLYADGIPATMPDGQGQVAHFDLAGAMRVEVLRGRSGLMNLRWSHGLRVAGLCELQLLARLDNLLSHEQVGSVIVNDANGRFFEPGAPRAALVSVRWEARW